MRIFCGLWSAIQSGASSVGPSGTRWRHKMPPLFGADGKGWAPKRSPKITAVPALGTDYRGRVAALNRPWNWSGLGPDAARARNRPTLSAARCAGFAVELENAGILELEVSDAAREAERDTTESISRQHPVHTWIGRPVQGKRPLSPTLALIHRNLIRGFKSR